MKFRTLKLLKRRREARKRLKTTEKAIQALIIGLALVLVLLVGCSYKMVPYETQIEYGTTDTDSKNSKLQEKKFITQKWRWTND
jgi:cell division protein FtsL